MSITRYLNPDALPLEEQARLGLLPDALPPADVARLWAAEKLGNPEHGAALENEVYGMAAIAAGLAVQVAPGRWQLTPATGLLLKRDDFRRILEAEGEPLPRFWFTEEERRAAQAHQAALARHGYTTVDELGAKKKARQLWQQDPTISKTRMRERCAVRDRPCPQAWIDEVHTSMKLPKHSGGRSRRR